MKCNNFYYGIYIYTKCNFKPFYMHNIDNFHLSKVTH